ncbi:hypothetical protein PG990_008476 [Apiospora arundinis]|uniref:MARVEL domain-containing protein n=1 Tax=Apiospora arundinis TaxID=335852 RepID=A0ABR2JNE1_9PEZI
MPSEHLYMMPNPGSQSSPNNKPPMSQVRLGPSPLMRALTGVSAVLGVVSLVALVTKCLSNVAWNEFGGPNRDGTRLMLTSPATKEADEVFFYPREVARFQNYSNTLMWVGVIVGVTLAPATAYTSWRVAKKGPYLYERTTRIFTYALYHLYWIYPLVVFAILTAAHAQSAHLPGQAPPRSKSEDGLYLVEGTFDLETLACEARNLAQKAGGQSAAADQLGRVCVGESATRGLLIAIAFLTAGLSVILELDRRGARRVIAVAENGRGGW